MNRLKLYNDNYFYEDLMLKKNPKKTKQIGQLLQIDLSSSSKIFLIDERFLLINLIAMEIFGTQAAKKNWSKKSIANFQLFKNNLSGCQITLQGKQLFNFLDKLVNLIFPHVRNFEGCMESQIMLSKGVTFGLKNLLLSLEFEETSELFNSLTGINITFQTSTQTKKECILILTGLQIPVLEKKLSLF
jgi:large subunit ribosomal protein L5